MKAPSANPEEKIPPYHPVDLIDLAKHFQEKGYEICPIGQVELTVTKTSLLMNEINAAHGFMVCEDVVHPDVVVLKKVFLGIKIPWWPKHRHILGVVKEIDQTFVVISKNDKIHEHANQRRRLIRIMHKHHQPLCPSCYIFIDGIWRIGDGNI